MVHYLIKYMQQLRKYNEAHKGRRLQKEAEETKYITKVRLVKQTKWYEKV